jgi:hypothetical protein
MPAAEAQIMKSNPFLPADRRQRGVVAVVFGLMLVVLIAFAGLAIDLGRFFVIKSELQNAVDACALAAASQLRPGLNDSVALNRAVAYGRVFTTGGAGNEGAIKNRVNFQSEPVNITADQITFAAALAGPYATASAGPNNAAKYAKCDVPLEGLPVYFMRILNLIGLGPIGEQTVSAMAVATLGSQTCNVVPVGVCTKNSADTVHHGLTPGEWLPLGDKLAPGVFGWVDYSPVAGGTPEVKDGLTATGQCDLPVVGASARENGKKTSAQEAWNTRFGIYSNPYRIDDIASMPPDKTGYAFFNAKDSKTGIDYPWTNWPRADLSGPNALDGSNAGNPNYEEAGRSLLAFQPEARTILSGPATFATGGAGNEYDTAGRSKRRVVVVPILDCSGKPMNIEGLACMLMLNPFGRVGGDLINGKLEYIGPASVFPCGNTTVTGPKMSVLVK